MTDNQGPNLRRIAEELTNSTDFIWFATKFLPFQSFTEDGQNFKREIAARFAKAWLRLMGTMFGNAKSVFERLGIGRDDTVSAELPGSQMTRLVNEVREVKNLAEFQLVLDQFTRIDAFNSYQIFSEPELIWLAQELRLKAVELLSRTHQDLTEVQDQVMLQVNIMRARKRTAA